VHGVNSGNVDALAQALVLNGISKDQVSRICKELCLATTSAAQRALCGTCAAPIVCAPTFSRRSSAAGSGLVTPTRAGADRSRARRAGTEAAQDQLARVGRAAEREGPRSPGRTDAHALDFLRGHDGERVSRRAGGHRVGDRAGSRAPRGGHPTLPPDHRCGGRMARRQPGSAGTVSGFPPQLHVKDGKINAIRPNRLGSPTLRSCWHLGGLESGRRVSNSSWSKGLAAAQRNGVILTTAERGMGLEPAMEPGFSVAGLLLRVPLLQSV
jgi:hypothetical protein